MKKAALFAAGIFFALTLTTTAQEKKDILTGNGNIIKEKRTVGVYSKISVTGAYDVDLVSGEPGTITIEGDENIVHLTLIEAKEGVLKITTENNLLSVPSHKNKIRIKVPFTSMEHIALEGCGSITAKCKIKNGNFKATVDGPGTINANITAYDTEVWILGAGTINIKGVSEKFTCKVVGSGNVDACQLRAQNVIASISGPGEAKVNSAAAITGRITGSGNIAFSGEPKQTDLKYLGSGNFTHD